jgi:FtsH-binding integral membrane protein
MKKVIEDTFSTFGIVFLMFIIWSLTPYSSDTFESNSLLSFLFPLLLILLGNYIRYRKKKALK